MTNEFHFRGEQSPNGLGIPGHGLGAGAANASAGKCSYGRTSTSQSAADGQHDDDECRSVDCLDIQRPNWTVIQGQLKRAVNSWSKEDTSCR